MDCALAALCHFSFDRYPCSLLQLADFGVTQLQNTTQHWKLFDVISDCLWNSLWRNNAELDNQQTRDRIFHYFCELIYRCEDRQTVERTWSIVNKFFSNTHRTSLGNIYKCLFEDYVKASMSNRNNWRMHQNWLMVLLMQQQHMSKSPLFNQNNSSNNEMMNLFTNYLKKILRECPHIPVVLFAILLVERLCLVTCPPLISIECEEELKKELLRHCQVKSRDHQTDVDFARHQVKWCAQWCLDNVLDNNNDNRKKRLEPVLIKLSPDRFEARMDDREDHFLPVRSQFGITSGVYFYEVTTWTSVGKLQFGWAMANAWWGCRLYSILLYFKSQKSTSTTILNNGKFVLSNLSDCQAGDVIGCLLDLHNRTVVLYCNGKVVASVDAAADENDDAEGFFESSSPYYATACLSTNQHCSFNFGQVPFKFAPEHDIPFDTIHKSSGKDPRKYCLAQIGKISNARIGIMSHYVWFKHPPVDNQIDNLFYRDPTQNKCDLLVKRVERDIRDGKEVDEQMNNQFEDCVRYIQAMIENMGKLVGEDKVDQMANWIGTIIEKTIGDKNTIENNTRVLELLYPYIQLQCSSTDCISKHRTICIVLGYLIRYSEHYDYNFIRYIRMEVFTYLSQTLATTDDQWIQLFALIAFNNLKLTKEEVKMLQTNERVMTVLGKYLLHDSSINMDLFTNATILESFRPLSSQLCFVSEKLFAQSSEAKRNLHAQATAGTLSIDDRTRYLELSPDLYSVRSDWRWQSVRYGNHNDSTKNKNVFYFEVLLLTAGPMLIGWSTRRTELGEAKLGADAFSIAFNGHNRATVCHQARQSNSSQTPQWRAGDVVGCLVCRQGRTFYFFLNDHPVAMPEKVHFSDLPYHPSVSLSAHQQVYCNFGQTNFKYPQRAKNSKNLSLLLYLQKQYDLHSTNSQVPSIDLSNSQITTAFIAFANGHNSSITNRDTTFNHITSNQTTLASTSSPSSLTNNSNNSNQSAYLTCRTCHKHISTKRLKSDCCEHIVYTSGEIPSFTLVYCNTSTSVKESVGWSNPPSLPPLICLQCHDSMTVIRVGCCDHLKFCTKCGSAMGSCVAIKCAQQS